MKKKIFSVLLMLSALFFLLFLGGIFYLLSLMKDPLRLTPLVRKYVPQIEIEAVSLDPFRSIQVRGLKLSAQNVQVKELEMQFSWSFFKHSVVVENLLLQGVNFRQTASNCGEAAPKPAVSNSTPFEVNRKMLQSLGWKIHIQEAQIRDVVVERMGCGNELDLLQLKQFKMAFIYDETHLQLKIKDFDLDASVTKDKLKASLNLNFPLQVDLAWREESILEIMLNYQAMLKSVQVESGSLKFSGDQMDLSGDAKGSVPLPLSLDLMKNGPSLLPHIRWQQKSKVNMTRLSLISGEQSWQNAATKAMAEVRLAEGILKAEKEFSSEWKDKNKNRNFPFEGRSEVELNLQKGKMGLDLKLANQELIHLQTLFDWQKFPALKSELNLLVTLDRQSIPSLPELKSLQQYGDFQTSLDASASVQDILNFSLQKLKDLKLALEVKQIKKAEKGPIELPSPLTIQGEVSPQGENGEHSASWKISSAQGRFKEWGWKDLNLSGALKSSGDFQKGEMDFLFLGSVPKLNQMGQLNLNQLLAGLKGKAIWQGEENFQRFSKLSMNLQQDWWNFHFSGSVAPKKREVKMQGEFQLLAKKQLVLAKDLQLSGEMRFPWLLMNTNEGRALFQGDFDWKHFSLNKGEVSLRNLHGSMPIKEEVLWHEGKVELSHYIDENPFMRVDWQRLRPMVNTELSHMNIEEIRWKGKSVGTFHLRPSLEQNRLQMEEAEGRLGKGSFYGKFFLDLLPQNMRLGIMGRLSQFDPSYLLTKKEQESANATIDARTAMIFDYNKYLLEGRIDITHIGKRQLFSMLEYLDPHYTDEQMNTVRSGLGVASPEVVAMIFHQGQMDIDIRFEQMASLGFNNFPLTPLLQTKLPPLNF